MVTPEWPRAPWYPLLRSITIRTLVWSKPLYLDDENYLRPRPRWDTRFSLVDESALPSQSGEEPATATAELPATATTELTAERLSQLLLQQSRLKTYIDTANPPRDYSRTTTTGMQLLLRGTEAVPQLLLCRTVNK